MLRETKYEMKESFEYMECSYCGCIQIVQIPDDLSHYYPNHYYSFRSDKKNFLKRYLKKIRARSALGKSSLPGSLLVKFYGVPGFVNWIQPLDLNFESSILDIGSGSGNLLLEMSDAGFKNLIGIDPFLKEDIILSDNARVYSKDLEYLKGEFDFIIFNHSFEHLPNPFKTLQKIGNIIPAGHYVLMRMPVAGTYAWRTFGTSWIQLDPPRHLFIYSEKSVEILAEKTGFELKKIDYDSVGFQFWGSLQAEQNIPLWSDSSYRVNPVKSIFSSDEIKDFDRQADELNEGNDGDQACFYLQKI